MVDDTFKILELEINTACNLSCSYCPNSIYPVNKNINIEPSTLDLLLSQLTMLKYEGNITLEFYNEPLLNTNITAIVDLIHNTLPFCKIILYSNGTLLTYDKFLSLLNAGIFKFIITKHENVSNYIFDHTYAKLTKDEKEFIIFKDHTQLFKTNRGGNLYNSTEKTPLLLPCYIPSFLVTVMHNGDVVACFEDYNKKMIMGNIHETNILDIWNSEKFAHFRRDLKLCKRYKYELCASCDRKLFSEQNFIFL